MADIKIESIDIGALDSGPVITLNKDDDGPPVASPKSSGGAKSQPSVNFGGGIELLMNEKRRGSNDSSRGGTDINLEDLQVLEEELNDLADPPKPPSKTGLFNKALHIESTGRLAEPDTGEEESSTPAAIGKATAAQAAPKVEANSGWGFGMFKNNVPIDPDKEVAPQPKLTPEETLREKFKFLRKLEDLERKRCQTISKVHYGGRPG